MYSDNISSTDQVIKQTLQVSTTKASKFSVSTQLLYNIYAMLEQRQRRWVDVV